MHGLEMLGLALAIGLVAFLYSSVGHAGASGYLAVMTLFGYTATVVKPTALILNILVASIGSYQFWRAGHFSWRLFWPFALLSVPAAYLGGYLQVPTTLFKQLVGLVLLLSAIRFFWRQGDPPEVKPPNLLVASSTGAGIGFLSGLTGTGGGIFLTPVMLLMRWARTRQTAATSVLFILVNSASGLTGWFASGRPAPAVAWLLALFVILGGAIGSYLGSRRFPVRVIQLLLATVLVIAGYKLLFT